MEEYVRDARPARPRWGFEAVCYYEHDTMYLESYTSVDEVLLGIKAVCHLQRSIGAPVQAITLISDTYQVSEHIPEGESQEEAWTRAREMEKRIPKGSLQERFEAGDPSVFEAMMSHIATIDGQFGMVMQRYHMDGKTLVWEETHRVLAAADVGGRIKRIMFEALGV